MIFWYWFFFLILLFQISNHCNFIFLQICFLTKLMMIAFMLLIIDTSWAAILINWSAFLFSIMFIENMLYTLHATYIKHDLYADFSLRHKRLLRENFLEQIHSSKEMRFLTAQISTVYFLSISCKHFICNTYVYCSRFLL